ncbi:glucosaminidase domain-containing protein [Elstera litoralis]|uniref:glucosaminidase domain-containing protein n=1 Tax=Elstera litoralis TaxID=552518 RepID=UPI0018DDE7F1|nr:glucosaminidase domain-containing protein [Elstera litoralis]
MPFTGRRLFTSLLGLLALESALATVLLIAAHPPQTPPLAVIHLPPAPAQRAKDLPPSELVTLAHQRNGPLPATPLQAFARLKPLAEPVARVMTADRIDRAPRSLPAHHDPLHPPARLPDGLPVDRNPPVPRLRETEATWLLTARDRLDPAPPVVAIPPEGGQRPRFGPNPALGRRIRSLNRCCCRTVPIRCPTPRRPPLPISRRNRKPALYPNRCQALTELVAWRDTLHGGPPGIDAMARTRALVADALVAGGYGDHDLSAFRGVQMFDYAQSQLQRQQGRRGKAEPRFGIEPFSGAFAVSAVSPPKPELVTRQTVPSTAKLLSLFDAHDYDTALDGDVPGVFLARLPQDLTHAVASQERKGIFVRSLLPHLLHVNAHILETRQRILKLAGRVEAGDLTEDDRAFVAAVLTEFRLERWSLPDLLKRVDIVPPSLALAQAAEESGWGTSNLARDGNALFGMVMWVRDAEGRSVRRQRPYADLAEGVASYVRNLNTHFAYAGFRDLRARLRLTGKPVSGPDLMAALGRYSERGQDYVRSVNNLLAYNNLHMLDGARLRVATVAEAE